MPEKRRAAIELIEDDDFWRGIAQEYAKMLFKRSPLLDTFQALEARNRHDLNCFSQHGPFKIPLGIIPEPKESLWVRIKRQFSFS